MSRFTSLAFKGTEWFTSVRPLNIALAGFVYSMVLLFLGAPVAGVWEFENIHGQDVGYAQTLNWAFGFALMAPLFAFFLLRSACEMDEVIKRLATRGMLLDEEYVPHPRARQLLSARWTNIQRDHSAWWLVISFIGLLASLGEWTAYSLLPLFDLHKPPESEYDWAVKYIGGDLSDRILNSAFSFLVFLQQAWLICLIGYLLFFTLSLTALMTDLRTTGRAVRLFPSLERCGKDSRLGYEAFASLFQFFLLGCLFLYVHFFFSRVWNAYLHPGEGEDHYTSVWGLIKGPLLEGGRDHERANGVVSKFLEYLEKLGSFNFSGVAVSLGALMLMLLSVALLVATMRKSASDARDELLESRKLKKSDAACLEGMAIWPLKYPGLTTLLALGVLGALSMVVYRLGVYFIGMVLVAALVWGLSEVRGKKESVPPNPVGRADD